MQCFSALWAVYTGSVTQAPVYMARRAVLVTNENFPCILCGAVNNVIYCVNTLHELHTHNRFTALLEFVRDHPGEQVPER